MGRSQRHKVRIQGVASDRERRANDAWGNNPVAGSVGGPLKGSQVPGPVRPTTAPPTRKQGEGEDGGSLISELLEYRDEQRDAERDARLDAYREEFLDQRDAP